jgi:hypothetical protein
MPAHPIRPVFRVVAVFCALCALAVVGGCGDERRYGDPGARLVAFNVHLERAYIRQLADRRIGVGVGAGESWSSSGASGTGIGVGLTFSTTTVTLFGGDGVAEAQVFRQELKWGDNAFAVPLTPGRALYLMVRAEGGHEGWESIGSLTVPPADAANPAVTIVLGGNGRTVTVSPPTVAPGGDGSATAAAAAPAAPATTAAPAPAQTPAVQFGPAPAPPAVAPAHTFPDPALDHR